MSSRKKLSVCLIVFARITKALNDFFFRMLKSVKTRQLLLNITDFSEALFSDLPQVLGSVKNRIEAFAASHEDFPAMLKKAQQYLVARGKVDWADLPAAVPMLRRSDSMGEWEKQTIQHSDRQVALKKKRFEIRKRNAFL